MTQTKREDWPQYNSALRTIEVALHDSLLLLEIQPTCR